MPHGTSADELDRLDRRRLVWREQRYLLHRPAGVMLRQDIQDRFAYGAAMSTPSPAEMLAARRTITAAADRSSTR